MPDREHHDALTFPIAAHAGAGEALAAGTPSDAAGAEDRSARGLPNIGLRWHADATGEIRIGWPAAGAERDAVAMGWLHATRPIGVMEACLPRRRRAIAAALERRFPGRRWFAGTWDVEGTSPAAEPVRQAA